MANCVLCGEVSYFGAICNLCVNDNSLEEHIGFNPFNIKNDRVRAETFTSYQQAWEAKKAVEMGGIATRKAELCGVLKQLRLDPNEKTFIETVLYGADGNAESIWGGETAYHRTQPRSNFTVVYKREENSSIQVIGIGSHIGNDNKKYRITFGNNKRLDCQRI